MEKRQKLAIEKARKYYFSLPKTIFCPALDSEVKISRLAWEHLVNKKSRTKKQTYYRSKVVYFIRQMLESSHFFQNRKQIDQTIFFSFQAVINNICYELVVRKSGGQPYQLYSFVYKGNV